MMIYVLLLVYGNVKYVLIIGGGDGVMLCEVFCYCSIEIIIMVEIDVGVVLFCCQYLLNYNVGVYDDLCFMLVIDDGVNFVNQMM